MSHSPRMCAWGPMRCSGPGVGWPLGAVVRDSVLWDGVQVGAGAQVRGCALATAVQVPAAATLVQEVRSGGKAGVIADE